MSVCYFDKDKPRLPSLFVREPSDFDSRTVLLQKTDGPWSTILVTFGNQLRDLVFEAKIELYGNPLIPKAIVKIALGSSSWPRLEKEYHTQLALAERGVKGIVSTFGLYLDESKSLKVLVMEDGGQPFTGQERTRERLK